MGKARKTAVRKPARRKPKTCKHLHANFDTLWNGERLSVMGCYAVWYGEDPNFGYGPYRQLLGARCVSCGISLPLGPSNDSTPEVQVEMRAAELEETEHWGPAVVLTYEHFGIDNHRSQPIDYPEGCVEVPPYIPEYLAGYLSAEIDTHDVREVRDATDWAWDPSRPLADQLAETARDDAAAESAKLQFQAECARRSAELGKSGPLDVKIDDDSEAPWSCPVDSNECAIRRQCTNKCGRKDRINSDLATVGPITTAAEDGSDAPTTVTIDSDGSPAVQINGLCDVAPLFTPDEAEALADDLLLGADAARQAAQDGHHGPAEVVEMHVGEEPEDGVEFEPVPVTCTAPHDGECQPAAWNDGPMVCVMPLRVTATEAQEQRIADLVNESGGIEVLRERARQAFRAARQSIADIIASDPDAGETTDPATKFGAQAYEYVGVVGRTGTPPTTEPEHSGCPIDCPACDAMCAAMIEHLDEQTNAAFNYESTRASEPDCRDEDGPEVERIMAEMERGPGPAMKRYLDHEADAACRRAGLLTAAEAAECAALSDSDVCQACGDKWTVHGQTCSGSAVEVAGG